MDPRFKPIVTTIAAVSVSIGVGLSWMVWSAGPTMAIFLGVGVAVGSFVGISRIVGPALDPEPNLYDTDNLRSYKHAQASHRAAEALENANRPQAGRTETDVFLEKMQLLRRLHLAGALTDDEFEARKAMLFEEL